MSTATAILTQDALDKLRKAPGVTLGIVDPPILIDGKRMYRVKFFISDDVPGYQGDVIVRFEDGDDRAHCAQIVRPDNEAD
jgi:hypothetical protein